MKSFIQFIRQQGVVGLAIGFLLGGAANSVVNSLVNDIIQPVLGLIIGQTSDLNSAYFKIFSAQISYGHFLAVLLNFLIDAAVVYYVFKILRLDKIDAKKE